MSKTFKNQQKSRNENLMRLGCILGLFPNSWYNYRVLISYFRESLGGSQNLVADAVGPKVAQPVFDDSSTLRTLFGLPVPDRCWIPW